VTIALDLKAAAAQKFTQLSAAYATGGASYWQLGHFFDTALDYFGAISAAPAAALGKAACANFAAKTGGNQWAGYWYDDHGWWANAALRASQHPQWFPSLGPQFDKIAARCWATMSSMAPTVWDRRPRPGGSDPFAALEPLIPGGVWNFSWSTGGSTPGCNPKSDTLCGIQNTVTNALFLMQAARRYVAYRDPACYAAATSEWAFLETWFDVDAPAGSLLNRYAPGAALARERVSRYLNAPAAGYESQKAWAGDQGLIVSALLDSMQVLGDDPDVVALAQAVLAGTRDKFAGDGLLLDPWLPVKQAWPDDYLTGPAVFFRNLLHAYNTNAALKAWIGDDSSGYPAFIRANAETAASQPPSSDMIDLTNALAALTVGIAVLS
jgi:hypothetical protein